MTPDRAQLIRAAAATAAQSLRVQGAAGHRGYSAADLEALLNQLGAVEALLADAATATSKPLVQAPPVVEPTAEPRKAAPTAAPAIDAPSTPVTTTTPAAPQRSAAARIDPAQPSTTPTGPAPWLETAPEAAAAAPSFDFDALLATGAEGLTRVRKTLGDCRRCGLCQGRTNIVFGVGNPSARIMFVGEGPGEEEDKKAEPFVGASGELLNRMIAAMGLRRDEVYIANVVKCRPPDNREPSQLEVARCRAFLQAQIACVSPEVIVTLGRAAVSSLTGKPSAMRSTRGKWLDLEGIAVMPTYHPAYILRLRDDELKNARREAWSDLQAVMARLGLRPPGAKV